MSGLVVYGKPGWGSAIIEAQLDWLGVEYRAEIVGDLFKSAAARDELAKLNPVAQVPTVVLPDGTVMTESAAITLHLADLIERNDLVPGATAKERAPFLRWLVFLVANVYPTFTYADDPARFVPDEGARGGFRATVDDYAKRMYAILEAEAGAPWFLGARFSALDIYLGVMTRWRPRRSGSPGTRRSCMRSPPGSTSWPPLRTTWARNFPAG